MGTKQGMTARLLTLTAALALLASPLRAQDLIFPPGAGGFSWDSHAAFALAHDLRGQRLTIFGPWRGEDQRLFETVLDYFRAATGAEVIYATSESHERQIVIDAEAGSPPDVAIVAQPGLIADLVARGHVQPLPADTRTWIAQNYGAGASWADLSTHVGPDGQPALYAFPYKAEVKSLVWYVPETFADAGLAVPQTLQDLRALTTRIAAGGETPWCIGLGSGGATGWPATDWVEDLLLRRQPIAVYDQWVRHEIPFDHSAVLAAIEEFGWFARTPGHVAGGAAAVAATDFRDSPAGLFASPPGCYLHRAPSFIASHFPAGVEIGTDVDFFAFPSDPGKGADRPVLGSGTFALVMRDGPAARAFIAFLQTPLAHEVWMAQTGFLTPFRAVNASVYGSDTLRRQGAILAEAGTFRFDGSDLMPGAVGAGRFWTAMVDFVGGQSAAEAAAAVEAGWPE